MPTPNLCSGKYCFAVVRYECNACKKKLCGAKHCTTWIPKLGEPFEAYFTNPPDSEASNGFVPYCSKCAKKLKI